MILGIFGAGGSGKLAVDFIGYIDAKHEKWSRLVFVDDVVEEREVYGLPVYRSKELLTAPELKGQIEVMISLGNPVAREAVFNRLKQAGIPLATIIDPSAWVSPSLKCGEGVIICKADVGSDACIGDNTIVYPGASIGHDVVIGKHNVISANTFIAGHCHIGDRVFVAPASAMRDRLSIGDDCVVSLGAALFKDMENEKIAIGNPARILSRDMSKGLFEK